jgi:ubiquinone/menaquinone biosynthesis C-methylase UbiE
MSFDLLAPHYRWMEWVLAGSKLQRCRTAFLPVIPAPHRVLLVGEGNGRFLGELLAAYPRARFTCVDASRRMLECARRRLANRGLNTQQVEFIRADIMDWSPPAEQFDLIVSHFFLDCFRREQLEQIVPRLASGATPEARWLLADFHEPAAGLAKWRARLILNLMYLFFRRVTGLPAAQLIPPDPLLSENGFVLRERRFADWGLLHSDLWVRTENRQADSTV